MKRPLGITILAILSLVMGILGLLVALPLVGVTAIAIPGISSTLAGVAAGTLLTLGIVNLIVASLYMAFGIGALSLRPWAWTLGVVAFGIGVLSGLVQLFTVGATAGVVVSLLISAGLLAYMYTETVKVAFDHEDGSLFHSGHPMGT